ncbi:MAG: hypothetical protein IPK83_16965 [Planctomycetes bacterium]|nr:hypothetical protein [Planctomycetota bacterium]
MKSTRILIVLLLAFGVIRWVRGSERFDIRRTLPLINDKSALFTAGSCALLVLGAWGLSRIRRAATGSGGPDGKANQFSDHEDDLD